MKHVAKERKSLGKKSIFNHVGPLTNPSRPTRMVVGVYSEHLGECMAKALLESGVESGIVVCGDQGLDEVCLSCLDFTIDLSHWSHARVEV